MIYYQVGENHQATSITRLLQAIKHWLLKGIQTTLLPIKRWNKVLPQVLKQPEGRRE